MKAVEFIGHEIKENTELAEHETGINNFKKGSEIIVSLYSWMHIANKLFRLYLLIKT